MIKDAFESIQHIERYIASQRARAVSAAYDKWNEERKRLLQEWAAVTEETPLLDEVLKQYPNDIKRENKSLSGRIPMRTFERIEGDLRKEMRLRGMRVWYYGKRKVNPRSGCTRRDEATHCMIYYN